jgi:hypothetical protein
MISSFGFLTNASTHTKKQNSTLLIYSFFTDRKRLADNGQVPDIFDELKFILLESGFDEAGSITKPAYLGNVYSCF